MPGAIALPPTDNDVTYVPLGFTFTFYNVSYSSVFVSANGNIQFQTASPTTSPGSLGTSSNSALAPFIAFFFSDLDPVTGTNSSRTYATIGSAPNRQFVLRYRNVPYWSATRAECSQVLQRRRACCTETTNAIEFRYYAVQRFLATGYSHLWTSAVQESSTTSYSYDHISTSSDR